MRPKHPESPLAKGSATSQADASQPHPVRPEVPLCPSRAGPVGSTGSLQHRDRASERDRGNPGTPRNPHAQPRRGRASFPRAPPGEERGSHAHPLAKDRALNFALLTERGRTHLDEGLIVSPPHPGHVFRREAGGEIGEAAGESHDQESSRWAAARGGTASPLLSASSSCAPLPLSGSPGISRQTMQFKLKSSRRGQNGASHALGPPSRAGQGGGESG